MYSLFFTRNFHKPRTEREPRHHYSQQVEYRRIRTGATDSFSENKRTQRRRDQESSAWNVRYGKVLSGTASASEIRSYFEHRRQVSEDAIEFAELVLGDYGSQLPDRDRGLLELAVQMHQTRLAELPRQEAEAQARKEEQDRRRAEWNGRPQP